MNREDSRQRYERVYDTYSGNIQVHRYACQDGGLCHPLSEISWAGCNRALITYDLNLGYNHLVWLQPILLVVAEGRLTITDHNQP